jgi:SAM-dependent methyltransferase
MVVGPSTKKRLLADVLLLPLRLILDHDTVEALGLTSLRAERIQAALTCCRGRVLDVGCGEGNRLVRQHETGVGVDVYPWPSVDVLCDTRYLPFADETFDTATFVASLNHIPAREEVLRETHRVLRPGGGRLIVTMINPVVGWVRHKLAWWDKDQHERGMVAGELYGMQSRDVFRLMEETGFTPVAHGRFLFGLNNVLVGEKKR